MRNKMRNRMCFSTLAAAAIALTGAITANAQSWSYLASPNPRILNSGWTFQVSVNGRDITVTNCVDAPSSAGVLPLGDPVSNYSIVAINGANRTGGVLGTYQTKATSLTLPESLKNIGDYAFAYCSELTGPLAIPNSVTNIGERAFYGCFSFNGALTIGNAVTTIGDYAFYSCESFTGALSIPNSVTNIGERAFYGCDNFNGALTIGNAVQTIGNNAFQYCFGFTGKLTLGKSVTSIGEYAFDNCNHLTGDLAIPDSVTSIGDYAFLNCSGFTNALTIGGGVTNIGEGAFDYCHVAEIRSPSSGVTLGNFAFSNNPDLKAVRYTGGYPFSVGTDLYLNSTNVTSYVTPDSASDWQSHVTGSIAEGTAEWCACPLRLDPYCWTYSPTYGGSVPCVTNAQGWVFAVRTAGMELTLTNCLASPLTSEALPLGSAVSGGYSIVAINGTYRNGGILGDTHRTQATSLTLPDSVTTIGAYAFYYCRGFTGSLTIPDAVTNIGQGAFGYCASLTGDLAIPNSVTAIGTSAFYSCSGFNGSLTIPDSVTNIGGNAFAGCSGFTGSLTIPDSVQTIGDYAFSYCSGFTGSLTLPKSVTNIGNYAFYYCRNITEIQTPSTDVSIGTRAFANMTALKAVRYTGGYPSSVGTDLYLSSLNVTSYVAVAYAKAWDPHVSPENGLTNDGVAQWQDRPILTYVPDPAGTGDPIGVLITSIRVDPASGDITLTWGPLPGGTILTVHVTDDLTLPRSAWPSIDLTSSAPSGTATLPLTGMGMGMGLNVNHLFFTLTATAE